MKIKVVNAGKCIICGKPIKLVVPINNDELPIVGFCRKCEPEKERTNEPRSDTTICY